MSNKCVVVLGMHRSGTSALTGFLHMLGLHAGNKLLPANEFNARGYFECADIVAIHDGLLDALGSSWHDVRPLPDGWTTFPAAQQAKSRLVSIFNAEFGTGDICVLKDPRICRLLPLWQEIFAELEITPAFIIATRHPEEVVASLAYRDAFHANKTLLLYQNYLFDAERHTRSSNRLILNFALLLRDWELVLQQITSAFNLALPPVSTETAEAIRMFLSPELKHFNTRPTSPEEAVDAPTHMARSLYQLLTAQQDETFEPLVDALRITFGAYLQTLEPWLSLAIRAESYERNSVNSLSSGSTSFPEYLKAQVYWWDQVESVNSSFTQRHSTSVVYPASNERTVAKLVFPPYLGSVSRIRLHIANGLGVIVLHDLRLEDEIGNVIWHWEGNLDQFRARTQVEFSRENPEGCCTVFLLGHEPKFEIDMPKEVLPKIKSGCALVLNLTASNLLSQLPHIFSYASALSKELAEAAGQERTAAPRQSVERQFSLTGDLSVVLSLLRPALDNKDKSIVQQDSQIQQLRRAHSQLREELMRAEAQLVLLKDLWSESHDERL